LAANALDEDAGDGDHVGGHEGGDGEGIDCVESNRGADVDEGQENGDDKGNEDCVKRDVPSGFDLVENFALACADPLGINGMILR